MSSLVGYLSGYSFDILTIMLCICQYSHGVDRDSCSANNEVIDIGALCLSNVIA